MKTFSIVVAACMAGLPLHAQEVVSLERAQKAARRVTETAQPFAEKPLKIDANLEQPQAISGGEVGMLVIPDKALTAEMLSGLGDAIMPIGQLWTHKASVAFEGKATANEKLRFFSVTDGDTTRDVQLYLLGAHKTASGALELVVFGKGDEPLLRTPIEKIDDVVQQKVPIELSGRKDSEESGTLTLQLPGPYRADILLMRPAQ